MFGKNNPFNNILAELIKALSKEETKMENPTYEENRETQIPETTWEKLKPETIHRTKTKVPTKNLTKEEINKIITEHPTNHLDWLEETHNGITTLTIELFENNPDQKNFKNKIVELCETYKEMEESTDKLTKQQEFQNTLNKLCEIFHGQHFTKEQAHQIKSIINPCFIVLGGPE